MDANDYGKWKEMVHFGLTSQDIVSTAFGCLLKRAYEEVLHPKLLELIVSLDEKASKCKIPMLAHTHGQPATTTTLHREIMVFWVRLHHQHVNVDSIPITAKFGGAVGNLSSHKVAYKHIDWDNFADDFVESLGLSRNHPNTCLLYTSPSPRDRQKSRMPSSA